MKVRFATNHGKGRSAIGSGSELINGFGQVADPGAKDVAWIIGAPGTGVFADLGGGEVLQVIAAFKRLVAFTTTGIFVVDANGASARIGDPIAGPISAAYNGNVVVAVNGSSGIVLDQNSVQSITDPDFVPANTVQFILGFFVFTRTGSGEYFISELYSVDFDGLDFATAEGAPDDTVAVVAVRREIWLMGEDTIEVHAAVTGSFPFAALGGVTVEHGCAAPFSAIKVSSSVFWLSPDGIVFKSEGYTGVRISTHEIEEELEELRDDWAEADAWTYIEAGHQFYCLNVGSRTFVFDLSTKLWHTRETAGSTRHLATCAAKAFGKVIVGDETGKLRHLSRSFERDEDLGDVVLTVGSVPFSQKEFFTTDAFEIEAEVGEGGGATLEYSDDTDGKTWSNRLAVSLGVLGEHDHVVEWRRLGRARNKRFRVRLFGPGPKRIGVTADLEAS